MSSFISRAANGAAKAIGAFSSLLYPPCCENCGGTVSGREYLCAACAAAAPRLQPPLCAVCSEPFPMEPMEPGEPATPFTCANCRERHFHFTAAVTAYHSEGVVREFIHRFKYNREFQLRFPLARWALEALADSRLQHPPIDALVPVPLFPSRERHREFNQAAVLARLVSREAGLPFCDCLLRLRNTTTQTRLDRRARMENLRNAFALRHNALVREKHLVLVDDIMTTGSTLDECARILCAGGAATVRALTVARG